MKIPKYVIELMQRAKYNYTAKGEHYATGYTIDIAKRSHYQYADTFNKEIEHLVKWCNSHIVLNDGWFDLTKKNAYILSLPNKSKYNCMQCATVTIYDPVMKHLEQYIAEGVEK